MSELKPELTVYVGKATELSGRACRRAVVYLSWYG
jgi:hypothetical protein